MPKKPKSTGSSRARRSLKPNQVMTKSGNTIKLHRSVSERVKARRDARALKKAELLRDMPKSRLKRIAYRLQPKRLAKYWFSKEGAIMALKITGAGIVVVFIIMIGVFAYFRKDLPNLKDISGNNIGGSIRYYDRTGQTLLWEDYDAVKRVPVKEDQINQFMKDATIAIEDKDFYHHGGFDVKGITRAGVANITGGSSTQGGSTITQQLVKLTQDWTKDKTYTRKIKELILAVELERSYSKNEILTGYLNTAPYGGIEYGVEAASRDYFQKPAKDLTLDEAAFLAAIPKSPSLLSPYSQNFEKAVFLGREQYVLDQMAEIGKITPQQRDDAKKVDVLAKVKDRPTGYAGIKAPYFVMAAKNALEIKYTTSTVKRGGWKVTTSINLDLQKTAEEQVQKGLTQIKRQGGDTAAFAVEDVKTGQMVAMVGGVDFNDKDHGQFNYAQRPLPPGSSFKPYDYTALLENTTNFGAGSVLYDTQGPIPGYACTIKGTPKADKNANCLWDYDLQYPGPLTLRYALGGSRNVPAVKAMLITGEQKVIDTAEKLGLSSGYKCYQPNTSDFAPEHEDDCYASAAIGDGAYLHLDEHVHGYASISRNGLNIPQTYILKIEDAGNKVVDEWKPSAGTQAVRPDAAYIVADMMSDPNASYFPAGRKPHRYKNSQGTWNFAMKTGTTNDGKDGWMMGFSTQYAAGVWVGYHSRQVVMTGTMENMTQPIWQGFMNEAHKNLKPEDRQKPSGVKDDSAFIVTRNPGIGAVVPSPSKDLYPSWYQPNKKSSNTPQTIDQVSNKLATECTPERAKKTTTDANANSFSGDTFVTGGQGSSNTDQKDDIHKCTDERPGISLDVIGSGGSYTLRATVTQGTHPLDSNSFHGTVNFKVNGQTITGGSFTVTDSGQTVETTYNPSGGGGDVDISAEVIDSVLYDAEDTKRGFHAEAFTVNASRVGGNRIKVTWSNMPSAASYVVTVGGDNLGPQSSPFTTTTAYPAGVAVTVTAKDGAAGSGNTIATGSGTAN